jgi:hypothetical protein
MPTLHHYERHRMRQMKVVAAAIRTIANWANWFSPVTHAKRKNMTPKPRPHNTKTPGVLSDGGRVAIAVPSPLGFLLSFAEWSSPTISRSLYHAVGGVRPAE